MMGLCLGPTDRPPGLECMFLTRKSNKVESSTQIFAWLVIFYSHMVSHCCAIEAPLNASNVLTSP